MPNRCSAFGCKSGYDSEERNPDISFHSFPIDEPIRSKWIQSLQRDNFTPSKYSRVCSVHFYEQDFETNSRDSHNSRRMKRSSSSLNLK